MLQPSTLKFIKDLTANNNKEWFDAHRKEYEAARKDHIEFIEALRKELVSLEPALEQQSGKDTIFRIFRDVRFSKDKTPYKNHFGAYFSKGGRKYEGPGWYLHVSPGNCFLAAGTWMPQGALLKATRQEIDYCFDEFKGIVESKAFTKKYALERTDVLRTVPQGYSADNPAIEYLKLKSFIATAPLSDEQLTAKSAVKDIAALAKGLQPFVAFLGRAME